MLDVVTTMDVRMEALISLLEGEDSDRSAPVLYTSFLGCDDRRIIQMCQVATASDRQAVICIFDPTDPAGPMHVGVAMTDGEMIKLQFGQLWLKKGAKRALLVPRGVDESFGHYAFDGRRFINKERWPAKDLTAGTNRASARLATLTAQIMAAM